MRTSYLDFLGRPPFDAELEHWTGKTRHSLATALFGSEEFWEHWIREQLFYLMLIDNFRPAAEVVGALPGELAMHLATPREVLHRIALTPSFDLRNPGADTFVTVVMEQFLGRTVQSHRGELEGGKAAYDGRQARFLGKPANSQADVVRIAIEDQGAARHLLTREYRRLLHGEPEPRELRGWVKDVQRDPLRFVEVLRYWYLSEPYDQRLETPSPKPNRLFVRGLFVDLFGRLPADDELEALRSALDGLADPRPLRSVLARALIDSKRMRLPQRSDIEDPAQWIAGRFERLLGRAPEDAELEVFLATFAEEGCEPATVVYALVSCAEYQGF